MHTHLQCYCSNYVQFTVATRDNHAELAFSEEFDTDTCGDFERVHVELIGIHGICQKVHPLPGRIGQTRQRARFQARNVAGSVGGVLW